MLFSKDQNLWHLDISNRPLALPMFAADRAGSWLREFGRGLEGLTIGCYRYGPSYVGTIGDLKPLQRLKRLDLS